MDKQKIIEEMQSLIKEIDRASYAYYTLDKPIMSDKQWDELYYRLQDLEKQSGIVLENSPTERVGGEILSGFNKVIHSKKLYSLGKAQTTAEILEWNERNQNIYKFNEEFSVEYKFDGLSICIKYIDGKLKLAATRGNGEIGEDVTLQVKTIKSVPLAIPYLGEIDIQGECIMRLSALDDYNKGADEKLKNARNAAAGAVRNLDPKVTAKRNLDFVAYNVNFCPDKKFSSQCEIQQFLISQGFQVGEFFKIAKNINEIKGYIEQVKNVRPTLDYLIDGMVIKVNDIKIRENLGSTHKVPRWAVAYKFEAEEASTKLIGVTWQVGRTGKITPVGELEPTELGGVTVKRATLNNINDIKRKKLKLGDIVFVRRSNDVIPEITGVAESFSSSKDIIAPSRCPCCGSTLQDTEAELYCINHYGCKTQIILRLSQFSSRNAMNIEGLSEKTIEKLYDKFGLKSFSDIYRITPNMLEKIEGFKDKKIRNILSSIQKSRNVKLSNFIFALGIDDIGEKTAKNLAAEFKTIQNLEKATKEQLVMMSDIADITAESILHYFSDPFNIEEIENLTSDVLIIENETEHKSNGKLTGKTFCLTGILKNYTRAEAEEIIENAGGKTTSSVTKNTNFVIVGENPGSKFAKAKALNIQILTESEFETLIK